MKKFLYAFSVLIVFGCLSSCEKENDVIIPLILEPEWSIDNFSPLHWEKNLTTKFDSKNQNEWDYPNPTIEEMAVLGDFIAKRKMTKALKRISKRIGPPDWDYAYITRHSNDIYIIMAPLIKKGRVMGTFEFIKTSTSPNFGYRAVSYGRIDKALKGKIEWNEPLKNIAFGLNNFRIAKGLNGYRRLNNWVLDQEIKSNSTKAYQETTTVFWKYNCGGICSGSFELTTSYKCPGGGPITVIQDDPTNDSGGDGPNPEEECEPGFERNADGDCVEVEEFPTTVPDCESFQWVTQNLGKTDPLLIACMEDLEIKFAFVEGGYGINVAGGAYTLQWTKPMYFEVPSRYTTEEASFIASNAMEEANAYLQFELDLVFNPDDTNWEDFVGAIRNIAENQMRDSLNKYGGRLTDNNYYNVSKCGQYESISVAEGFFKCPNFPYLN